MVGSYSFFPAYVTVKEDASSTPLDTSLWQDIVDIGAQVVQKFVTHRQRNIKSEDEMLADLKRLLSKEAQEAVRAKECIPNTRELELMRGVNIDRWELAWLLFPTKKKEAQNDMDTKANTDTDTDTDSDIDSEDGNDAEKVSIIRADDEGRSDLIKTLFMRYGHGRDTTKTHKASKDALTDLHLSCTLSSNQVELIRYAERVQRQQRAESSIYSGDTVRIDGALKMG